MTIGSAIGKVQEIKPNGVSRETMVDWLNEIDTTIYREIVKTHEFAENLVFTGYSSFEGTDADRTMLLAPEPYSRLYIYWLCAQIDLQNQEFDLYQNNAALFNQAYREYQNYCNRNFMPVERARFKTGGNKR